ncbi:hypothetical protein R5W24_003611 [Gemmata sp. JC717]|uniref:hypothetical protein n=1 Tax=Gemmata algarum TaxID=2975278 RepID=UPI0021BA48E3|nr:hypothetical protein [Gemmata algarum]MDY3554487.1 hypothetical protein [Gemmata algarum]
MTADAWDRCDAPRKLLEWVRRRGSDRRFRLFACAFWRWAEANDGEPPPAAARALQFAESWAESGVPPDGYPAGFPGWHPLLARTGFDAASWSVRGSPACGRAWIGEAEQAQQLALIREVFGNPFRRLALAPAWQSETVLALARGIYADRAFDRLPILADALQDAGCADADALAHCRGPEPHVRGCWVVDMVLGKE